jgi:hypothetical protein
VGTEPTASCGPPRPRHFHNQLTALSDPFPCLWAGVPEPKEEAMERREPLFRANEANSDGCPLEAGMTRRARKTKPIRLNLVRERRLTLRQAPELLMRRAKRSQIATHPGRTNTKPASLARDGSFILCGRRDLNPHGLLRYPLKIVCLPIPPLPQLPSSMSQQA